MGVKMRTGVKMQTLVERGLLVEEWYVNFMHRLTHSCANIIT